MIKALQALSLSRVDSHLPEIQGRTVMKRVLGFVIWVIIAFTVGQRASAHSYPSTGTPIYSLVAVPTLGGSTSAIYGVNSTIAVGEADYPQNGVHHAIAMSFSAANGPGTLVDIDAGRTGSSGARAINSRGVIVGYYADANGKKWACEWYLRVTGSSSTYVRVSLGLPDSCATHINDNNMIVGQVTINRVQTGFYGTVTGGATPGTTIPYPTWTVAFNGINTQNEIVINAPSPTGSTSVYDIASKRITSNLGYNTIQAVSNDQGQVVATDVPTGSTAYQQATLLDWSPLDTSVRSLGYLGSFSQPDPMAMNNYHQVVGEMHSVVRGGDPRRHAFEWSIQGWYDLNNQVPYMNQGYFFNQATCITDNRVIGGIGTKDGVQRGFILLPTNNFMLDVWWPDSSTPTLSGVQPFKALVYQYSFSSYAMSWQVDHGQQNAMYRVSDNANAYDNHYESMVDLSGWGWRGTRGGGPYQVNFTAWSSDGKPLKEKQVFVKVYHP
jgi:hypothetical protein